MTIDADPTEPAGDAPPRQLDDLPAAVRQRVIEWAAAALGTATAAEIPASLTRFAKFAPGKRAKLAAAALGQALRSDPAFRALVAERAAAPFDAAPTDAELVAADPIAAGLIDAGLIGADPIDADPIGADPIDADPIDADPIDAAARGFLIRAPDEAALLATAQKVEEQARGRARVIELEARVRTLAARLERVTAELAAARVAGDRHRGRASAAEPNDEADRLRLRLRAQGTQIRELREQLATEGGRSADLLAGAIAERDRAQAEAESWRSKAEAAEARAENAVAGLQRLREAKGDRRATSDRRLELLLSALEGAASGLRREWDLVGGGAAPADVVAAGWPRPATDGIGGRGGERTTDPARLTAWAGMPGAHLIVDGYNVTKTGFGELSLSDQRDRLVRSLGALAARTSAEITVVFDGAAVAAVRPPARGIRVLFSPPGVLADDVIRDLVRAEPVGRTVIVVSSDREVVDRAAADGARTAASTVLLAAMGG